MQCSAPDVERHSVGPSLVRIVQQVYRRSTVLMIFILTLDMVHQPLRLFDPMKLYAISISDL